MVRFRHRISRSAGIRSGITSQSLRVHAAGAATPLRQQINFKWLFLAAALALLFSFRRQENPTQRDKHDYHTSSLRATTAPASHISENGVNWLKNNHDQDFKNAAADPCCGPWTCAFYENESLEGVPLATLFMENLATDWQKEIGFGYDGVPALNYTKKGFYMKCTTHKEFRRGYYKLMPFIQADYILISIDGKTIHHGKKRNRKRTTTLNLDALYFNTTDKHLVQVVVGVTKESRSWAMFSWVRLHNQHNNKDYTLTPLENIACITTPECYGPTTVCQDAVTKGLGPGEESWGLCRDFVASEDTDSGNSRCLVYSIGIRDIYQNELLMGREGCEVHAFDCTVKLPENLGPNVTFHPWCLGSSTSELKLDGGKHTSRLEARDKEFLSLPTIVRRLGHEHEELTVLKMDCEGCEWNGLDLLKSEMPDFFDKIRMLMLEMHYVTDSLEDTEMRMEEIRTMNRVADSLKRFRVYEYGVNSDTSIQRFNDTKFFPELYKVGLFVGACCYEFNMVREDLVF